MKKAEFLLEVMAELENIKAKATIEEIDKLVFDTFNHESVTVCIYGQMTGRCDSKRAIEITPKTYEYISGKGYNFRGQDYNKRLKLSANNYTPLEKYLYIVKKPMHKKIIAYLKGETDTLELI